MKKLNRSVFYGSVQFFTTLLTFYQKTDCRKSPELSGLFRQSVYSFFLFCHNFMRISIVKILNSCVSFCDLYTNCICFLFLFTDVPLFPSIYIPYPHLSSAKNPYCFHTKLSYKHYEFYGKVFTYIQLP